MGAEQCWVEPGLSAEILDDVVDCMPADRDLTHPALVVDCPKHCS